MIDMKQLSDGRWIVCDPMTGRVYAVVSGDEDAFRVALDVENGWRPERVRLDLPRVTA